MEERDGRGGEASLALRPAQTLPVAPEDRSPLLAGEIAAAQSYRRRAKSANTLRAYESDWRQFGVWCDERGLEALPARVEAVATYLAVMAQAGRADSTIGDQGKTGATRQLSCLDASAGSICAGRH